MPAHDNPMIDAKKQQALALVRAHRLAEAKTLLEKACALDRDDAEAWYLRAAVNQETGDLREAVRCYLRVIELAPDNAEAHYYLGNAYLALDMVAEAAVRFAQTIRLKPDFLQAHCNLGAVHEQRGNYQQALESYRQALHLDPERAELHYNVANALRALNEYEKAADHYRQAIRLNLGFAEAYNNLGNALVDLGQREEAVTHYRESLRLKPDYVEAYNNLGNVLAALGLSEEALASYRRAIEIQPDYVEAYTNLGNELAATGRHEEAIKIYRQALDLAPNDGLRIRIAMLLPVIPQSVDDIAGWRAGFLENVTRLAEESLILTDPAKEVGVTNFYLAYHGQNNRELHRAVARLYERACPSLLWTAPHCRSATGRRTGPIKVGFISKYMRNHSIGKTTRGLVAKLSRDRFRVYALFVPPFVEDEISRFIREQADESRVLPASLESAREQIAALELDVLFYQDIGMEPFTYFLAYSRLAPVQCVSFGHPDTTGIGNMDYFISSDLFETVDAASHYSEKLFLLHNLGTLAYYYRPHMPEQPKARHAFGLPEDKHVYICPQTLFKFHPDFDPLLRGILRADPAGIVALIEPEKPSWRELLHNRFRNSLGEFADRVCFVPRQNGNDFLNLLSVTDVMLDTPHFNGMNSNLEAFSVGVPVVTLPKNFQRGRHTCGMYRRMNMTDCVARDEDHYMRLAVQLGTDKPFREQVSRKIRERCVVLYEDMSVVLEFERFFKEAFKAVSRGNNLS